MDIIQNVFKGILMASFVVVVFVIYGFYLEDDIGVIEPFGHYLSTKHQDFCETNDTSNISKTTKPYNCKSNIGFLKTARPFVALASFPGSGNTWTRELLEDLTGIYTGSIYPDILVNMPGSHTCPLLGKVYIIKTHRDRDEISHPKCQRSKMKTSTGFDRAIFILRNPYDALVSEFNRINGGKVGVARPEQFNSTDWKDYVKKGLPKWRAMLLFWTTVFDKHCHVLVYERMTRSQCKELTKLGEFLLLKDFKQKISCILSQVKTKYKRKKPDWLHKENLFNEKMKSSINEVINQFLQNDKVRFLHEVLQGYVYQ